MHVAGLGVDGRDDAVRRHPLGDPPRAVVVLLDVLAGDQGQQPEGRAGLGSSLVDLEGASRARASLTRPSTRAALATGSSQAISGLPAAS